jgi:UTP:GlnB (protein PII) uridylyltransferase
MEAHVYNFHMHCKKSSGVIVQLTRALEALQVDILNANITSIDNHVLNTCVVRVSEESIGRSKISVMLSVKAGKLITDCCTVA